MLGEFMNLHERGKYVLAQGETGTNSKRPSHYIEGVYPTHALKGIGSRFMDESGRTYIDFVSGLGTNILGYNHPKVTESVMEQLKKGGPSYSLPHHLEVEVAEMIQEIIPHMEKVRFLKTGNEATLASIRIVRAYRGNEGWIESDSYHGHGDLWTSLTPPGLGIKDSHRIFSWGNPMRINIEDKKHQAAFICEPIQISLIHKFGNGEEMSRKELLSMIVNKSKADWHIPIIFDEVVSGFRVPKYTVSQWWDIQPDITCLGKAIANGFPLSVVGGKKEVMDCGEYFISSTYSGEAMSLAACKATLQELKQKSMDDLMFYGKKFCNEFNKICEPIGSKIEGYGTRGQTDFYENENTVLLFQELCKAGVFMGRAFFYNFAHMEEEVEKPVLSLVYDAVERVKKGLVKLEGKAPRQTFKR